MIKQLDMSEAQTGQCVERTYSELQIVPKDAHLLPPASVFIICEAHQRAMK